jgi:hypothetical protein
MSSKETPGAQEETRETAADLAAHQGHDGGNNPVAQKLSNELDKWRRQRNGARPRRFEATNGSNSQPTGPARTIKVRGHETLVVRKPKVPKPDSDSALEKN